MSAAKLKPIRLKCYHPRLSGVNKVSLFRAGSLVRYVWRQQSEFVSSRQSGQICLASTECLFRAGSLVRYVWHQHSEFVSSRQSVQTPAAVRIGFECHYSVAISMYTHVGLNVTTRVWDVCPDKCWFAVVCRFWLQCSHPPRHEVVLFPLGYSPASEFCADVSGQSYVPSS